MASLARTVTSNVAYGMVAQLVVKVASFFFSMLIIRRLGAESYGQYTAVLAFGAMFVFIADLGLSPWTVREVARVRDRPDGRDRVRSLFGDVLGLRLLLGLFAGGLCILTAWITGRPPLMILAIAINAIGLLLYCVQGTCDAILAGFERLDRSAGAKVAYQIAFVTLGAAALAFGLGYFGLIFATLAAIALMTVICWVGVRKLAVRPAAPRAAGWPTLLHSSLPFGLIGLTLGLSYKFDSVLLNITRGDAETGYYNAAYSLIFSAAMISNVINFSLFPSLTRAAGREPIALGPIYNRVLRYLLLIAAPVAVGGAALADQLIPFLFGADYAAAIPAFRMLIWVVPLMFVSEFLGYIVTIKGQERRIAQALAISTAFNVAVNLAVVPVWGLYGAAVVTVCTELVLVGQYIWLLRGEGLRFDLPAAAIRPFIAALVMGCSTVALRLAGVPMLLNIALSAVVFAAAALAWRCVGPEEAKFLRSLWQSRLGHSHGD